MPLYDIEISRLRDICRERLENLELWMRRIIDEEFSSRYGDNYFDYVKEDGKQRLIKNSIRESALMRVRKEPLRYNRTVDGILLDDSISIMCNRNNVEIFKDYFKFEYLENMEFARETLMKLVPIRNKLSHAHEISVREAERVICYTEDAINSFKECFKERNLEKEYNAPIVVKVRDSLSNIFESTQIIRNGTGRGLCDTRMNGSHLYSSDKLSIEIEVDPSFPQDSYTISWIFENKERTELIENKNKLTIKFDDFHVREDFAIYVIVKSDKSWHRCGNCDDSISIIYKVLPSK